jgi:hypothetical protein
MDYVELMFESVVEQARQHRSNRIKALLVRLSVPAIPPMIRYVLFLVGRLSDRT